MKAGEDCAVEVTWGSRRLVVHLVADRTATLATWRGSFGRIRLALRHNIYGQPFAQAVAPVPPAFWDDREAHGGSLDGDYCDTVQEAVDALWAKIQATKAWLLDLEAEPDCTGPRL